MPLFAIQLFQVIHCPIWTISPSSVIVLVSAFVSDLSKSYIHFCLISSVRLQVLEHLKVCWSQSAVEPHSVDSSDYQLLLEVSISDRTSNESSPSVLSISADSDSVFSIDTIHSSSNKLLVHWLHQRCLHNPFLGFQSSFALLLDVCFDLYITSIRKLFNRSSLEEACWSTRTVKWLVETLMANILSEFSLSWSSIVSVKQQVAF